MSGVLIGCLVVVWCPKTVRAFEDDFLTEGEGGLEAGVLSSLSSLLLLQEGGVGGRWKALPGSTFMLSLGSLCVVVNKVLPLDVVSIILACLSRCCGL